MATRVLTNDHVRTAALIFAGGRSSRMGTDKALLNVDGMPLIARVRDACAGLGSVVVVGGDRTDFEGLGTQWCGDEHPGEGPLGALVSGMGHVHADIFVAAACDLPHLDASTVDALADELARSTAGVAVPLVAGTHQWHIAAWRRSTFDQLATLFANGERSLRAAARTVGVVSVVYADVSGFVDIDTPEDLRAAFPQ